jgi:hypothetical protein
MEVSVDAIPRMPATGRLQIEKYSYMQSDLCPVPGLSACYIDELFSPKFA